MSSGFVVWKLLSLCALVVTIEGYKDLYEHVDQKFHANCNRSTDYAVNKRLEKLKEDLEKVSKFNLEDSWIKFVRRVENLENHCKKEQFQCGGTLYQCIHQLKVCDGIKDCFNGHDEDLDVCFKSFFTPGTKFDYRLTWKSCENWPDLHFLGHVVEVTRSKLLRDIATVTADFGSPKNYVLKGDYNFGTGKLVFLPQLKEHKSYKIVCDFSDGSKSRSYCLGIKVSSNVICAHGYFLYNTD